MPPPNAGAMQGSSHPKVFCCDSDSREIRTEASVAAAERFGADRRWSRTADLNSTASCGRCKETDLEEPPAVSEEGVRVGDEPARKPSVVEEAEDREGRCSERL